MPQAGTAVYRAPGDTIDYTPGSAVTAGDIVVVDDLIGVASQALEASKLGALRIKGIFRAPVKTGDTPAAGEVVYWDGGNTEFTTTSAADLVKALCVVAPSGGYIEVLLTPGAGVGS